MCSKPLKVNTPLQRYSDQKTVPNFLSISLFLFFFVAESTGDGVGELTISTKPAAGTLNRKAKNSDEAEQEVVSGYRNSVYSIKYSTSILSREATLIQEKRNTIITSPTSETPPSRLGLEGKPSLKKIAESFIKAYRFSKSLNIGDAVERMNIGPRSIVTRGSLLGLVGQMMRINQELDIQFLQEFLITHPLFMSSAQLLRILMSFYTRQEVSPDDDPVVSGAKIFVQVRVLDVMDVWLSRHPAHFTAGTPAESLLGEFLMAHLLEYPNIPEIVESLQQARGSPPPEITWGKDLQPRAEALNFLVRIQPADFAKQLTDVSLLMFSEVPVNDIFAMMRDPRTAPAPELRYIEAFSEKLSLWVARNICLPSFPRDRGAVIAYFLEVASCSLEMNNFNGVFQILRGFMTSSIRRLKTSWDSVSSKHKRLFEELKEFTSPANNFEVYRNKLRTISNALLPSLHVYLHDLLAVNHLHEDRLADGRVNFYKFHLIGSIMDNIHCCQQQDLPPPTLNKDLENLMAEIVSSPFSKRDLVSLSFEREPSESPDSIYGANLTDLVTRTGVPCEMTSGMIPLFLRDLYQYLRAEDRLKTVGIFRMSGNKNLMEKIKLESEKLGTLWIPEGGITPHEAAGLLKLFFSSLSDSVFTTRLHSSFVRIGEMSSKKEQLDALKLNFALLPQAHRDVTISLLKLCSEVVSFEGTNLMSLGNLAVIFAPTLFTRKKAWDQMKEKFFSMRGTVDMKSLVKQKAEQDILRPLMELMIHSHSDFLNSSSLDLPDINAVYHQHYGDSTKKLTATLSSNHVTPAVSLTLSAEPFRHQRSNSSVNAASVSPSHSATSLHVPESSSPAPPPGGKRHSMASSEEAREWKERQRREKKERDKSETPTPTRESHAAQGKSEKDAVEKVEKTERLPKPETPEKAEKSPRLGTQETERTERPAEKSPRLGTQEKEKEKEKEKLDRPVEKSPRLGTQEKEKEKAEKAAEKSPRLGNQEKERTEKVEKPAEKSPRRDSQEGVEKSEKKEKAEKAEKAERRQSKVDKGLKGER